MDIETLTVGDVVWYSCPVEVVGIVENATADQVSCFNHLPAMAGRSFVKIRFLYGSAAGDSFWVLSDRITELSVALSVPQPFFNNWYRWS